MNAKLSYEFLNISMMHKFEFFMAILIGLIYAVFVLFQFALSLVLYGKKALSGPKFRSRPKILSDPRYGKSSYLHLQDITMHYVANGDPSRPLLLLIHGFPEFWFSWRHQLSSELAQHFRVVAIDMRGYGDSDKPIGIEKYRMACLLEDLRQAIKALGYSSCHLVGHDWGGSVAWAFAVAHPQMVTRLVALNCPHPGAFQTCLRSTRAQFFRSWYLFFFQLPRLPEWFIGRQDLAALEDSLTGKSQGVRRGVISAEELEAFKFTFSAPGSLTGPINYYRASFRYPRGVGGSRQIEQPTMLVFGCRDRFITESAARLSGRFCRSLDYRPVPEASHWVQQDAPDTVNRLLMEHLLPGRLRVDSSSSE